MRTTCVVLGMVILFLAGSTAASADVFGLAPTLMGNGPGLVVEQRGASGPLPSNVIGLEAYSLFGRNAGAAGAVTFKRRFASTPIADKQIRWRYGIIGGVSMAGTGTQPLIGGFVEGEVEGIVGLVLIVRADDGVYLQPGFKVNVLSASF